MIDVQGLTKTYGSVVAVRNVSFHAGKGVVLGLLGPNGAGKTTTLRMLAGVLGPSSGTIRIGGHDLIESPIQARRCLGYLAETSPLYPEMRVGEYLSYRAALKGIKRKLRREAVEKAAASAHCDDVAGVRVAHLSRGYRQRVGLADALLADPPVLLLDEPTAGLDPNQIREVRDLIAQLAQRLTIVLSTHVLAEIEAICNEALVIDRGQLVAHDSLDALRASSQGAEITLLVRDPDQKTPSICADLGWRIRAESREATSKPVAGEPGVYRFIVYPVTLVGTVGDRLEELIVKLVEHGVGLRGAHRSSGTLEAVFAELTDSNEARSK